LSPAPDPFPLPPLPRHALLPVLLALVTAGCGLADYEARITAEKAKLQRLDREARHLGDPLKMPPPRKEGEREVSWSAFLRAPKAIGDTPQGQLLGGILAVYPATGTGNIQTVYLGVGATSKDVLPLFPFQGEVRKETVQVETSARPLTFTRYTYDDNRSSLAVNFLEGSTTPVAIVYRAEKGRLSGDSADAVQASLGTLGVDGDLARARQTYENQKSRRRY
jgi:hypothetical protein